MQLLSDKAKMGRPRLGSISSRKEPVRQRQVFLFTHHILLTTREKGRLHLAKVSIDFIGVLNRYFLGVAINCNRAAV